MVIFMQETPPTTSTSTDAPKPAKLLRCPQEGCDKVFRSSPGYRYHLKSHALDPRPHMCQCCHKKFKSANGLKYHLRKAHQIEPITSKHNLEHTSNELDSPDEHPYTQLTHVYHHQRRPANLSTPLIKNPRNFLSASLKNFPGTPSPLIKSSTMELNSCISSSSSCSSVPSSYIKNESDAYIKNEPYFNKQYADNGCVNYDYSKRLCGSDYQRQTSSPEYNNSYGSARSSLSEYTQQCQQANSEFRQQCQRLSTEDIQLSSVNNRNKYYLRPDSPHCMPTSGISFSSDYRRPSYSGDYNHDSSHFGCQNIRDDYNPRYRDFEPNEGKEYPSNLVTHNPSCLSSHRKASYEHFNSGVLLDNTNNLSVPSLTSSHFKVPNNIHNTEQIVPDINVPNQVSPTNSVSCDRNNNNSTPKEASLRKLSESSNDTEFSDCVFDSSNHTHSPKRNSNNNSPVNSRIVVKSEPNYNCNVSTVSSGTSTIVTTISSVPLLSRRISRTKSIPPLFLPTTLEGQDKDGKDDKQVNNKLLHLAEIATSPRSPFQNSPLPMSLTPSLLHSASGTPDWTMKSPLSKLFFPGEKSFLSTPTPRSDASVTRSDTLVSLSPFLDNVQTPSFWPTMKWPTPVWLCFLKGCCVKFEQDDKEFMNTEDVAVFCTTPGGRRRDDMNFYTSGMKVREIKEETSLTSARDMVELAFEQIIPGPQRLVAKCPIDHPFYIKNKGWSAPNPTEAMARYGIPFKRLRVRDICLPASRNYTPSTAMSPCPSMLGPGGPQNIFTFSPQDTSRFVSQSKKTDIKVESPSEEKAVHSNSSPMERTLNDIREKVAATLELLTSRNNDTITLTYSKSPTQPKPPFITPHEANLPSRNANINTVNSTVEIDKSNTDNNSSTKSYSKKKRRKPLSGNEQSRRPMNGFMLFGKTMRVELTKQHTGKDNRAISKLLGEKWRELSEEKREDYSRMAKTMADERMKLNPNCWKRKHRKEKDTSNSKPVDNHEFDTKKSENGMFLPPKYQQFIKPEDCMKQEPC